MVFDRVSRKAQNPETERFEDFLTHAIPFLVLIMNGAIDFDHQHFV